MSEQRERAPFSLAVNRAPGTAQAHPGAPLLDQQLALSAYLQALLTEPLAEPLTEPVALRRPAPDRDALRMRPPPPVDNLSQETAAPATVAPTMAPEVAFPSLLFQVAGVTLAVPLTELAGVIEWPHELAAVPAQPPWHLGLLARSAGAVPVVDLAGLILPPERLAEHRARSEAPTWRRIVLVGGGRWGLASERVDEVVTLAPEEVRWRSARTRRAWLAGTVIARMCALVDALALVRILDGGLTGAEDA